MPSVTLKTNTKIYSGWTRVKVQRGIEQAAGAFAIELTERWPAQSTAWPIEPGDACELLLDEQIVITGYVDSTERKLNASEHSIRVIGRDKTGDIVDCAALQPGDRTDKVNNQTLLQIVQTLTKPYGIEVSADLNVDSKIKYYQPDIGETVWDLIARYARQKAVLLVSDGKGGLRITRAGGGSHLTALVEGKNILQASLLRDNSNRFRRYIIRGQQAGNDDLTLQEIVHGEARTTDDAITRERVMLFQPDTSSDQQALQDRAKWERNVRRAKSRRINIVVQGWSANGEIWQPNRLVDINIPTLKVFGKLLIVSVTHVLDSEGKRTEMLLSPAAAYDMLPEAEVTSSEQSLGIDASTMEILK